MPGTVGESNNEDPEDDFNAIAERLGYDKVYGRLLGSTRNDKDGQWVSSIVCIRC
jgi:hypothetical protein